MIKANLIHLSTNMWSDNQKWPTNTAPCAETINFVPDFCFDEDFWHALAARMANAGFDMVVFDVGDAVKYKSHPEIAVKGAWTPARLKHELAACRKQGLEPIPKLNFSAGHDAWMGAYSRMVSTKKYYQVCRDLINEVCELFGGPRFFHLGMDEETAQHQVYYDYAVMRQHDLWWADLNFLIQAVEKNKSAAWVWSDVLWWRGEEVFLRNMPKSVIQSNWAYWDKAENFNKPASDLDKKIVMAFRFLDHNGYRQVPTGSNYGGKANISVLADYCLKNISHANLLGFMQTTWMATLPAYRRRHEQAIDAVADAAKQFGF